MVGEHWRTALQAVHDKRESAATAAVAGHVTAARVLCVESVLALLQ
jgi:hypothetical protein